MFVVDWLVQNNSPSCQLCSLFSICTHTPLAYASDNADRTYYSRASLLGWWLLWTLCMRGWTDGPPKSQSSPFFPIAFLFFQPLATRVASFNCLGNFNKHAEMMSLTTLYTYMFMTIHVLLITSCSTRSRSDRWKLGSSSYRNSAC
jgi:hypothetical protein